MDFPTRSTIHPTNFLIMNKYIRFLVLMCILLGITSISLHAQSMEERQKEPFNTLDLTQVPTSLLMDRTLGYIDFSVLDGYQMVDSIRLSSRDYPYAYAMLHIANVDISPLRFYQ